MNHSDQSSSANQSSEVPRFSEEVELQGHIIDSLLLPKILDEITVLGGDFSINDISIGQLRSDSSHAQITVSAEDEETLENILTHIAQHGAAPVEQHDCVLDTADMDGAFPEGFYCTTNQADRNSNRWKLDCR